MEEIYKIETIEQYNNMYGFKTMHPLVAYVEFNESNSKFIPGRHRNISLSVCSVTPSVSSPRRNSLSRKWLLRWASSTRSTL